MIVHTDLSWTKYSTATKKEHLLSIKSQLHLSGLSADPLEKREIQLLLMILLTGLFTMYILYGQTLDPALKDSIVEKRAEGLTVAYSPDRHTDTHICTRVRIKQEHQTYEEYRNRVLSDCPEYLSGLASRKGSANRLLKWRSKVTCTD